MRSKTGLLASTPISTGITHVHRQGFKLRAIAKPAPIALKPFAGIYNPYRRGCSVLCNHPADTQARDVVKRAKDTWATQGKNILLAEEVVAIEEALEKIKMTVTAGGGRPTPPCAAGGFLPESFPEELFRRYTETDSRPPTPAPTMVSAHTRVSGSRRCVTPDPFPIAQRREKILLILDLRRSHSQETLSWHGSGFRTESSFLRGSSPDRQGNSTATPSGNIDIIPGKIKFKIASTGPNASETTKHDSKHLETSPNLSQSPSPNLLKKVNIEGSCPIRRRGKKRNKKGRDGSRGPPAIQISIDPETQVGTADLDSNNPSARGSLVPNSGSSHKGDHVVCDEPIPNNHKHATSYIEDDILNVLRRNIITDTVDTEFNLKKRLALEEAVRTANLSKKSCKELIEMKEELNVAPPNVDLWLSLPRIFSRSCIRFELPMDSREFNSLSSLRYLKEYVFISNSRKQLYNCIFHRHIESDDDKRYMNGKSVKKALGEVMGAEISEAQITTLRELLCWTDEDVLDFKTFCGLSGLCERILANEFCPNLLTKKEDPCQEIEKVDFKSLSRRMTGHSPDKQLVKLLEAVSTR